MCWAELELGDGIDPPPVSLRMRAAEPQVRVRGEEMIWEELE